MKVALAMLFWLGMLGCAIGFANVFGLSFVGSACVGAGFSLVGAIGALEIADWP